MLYALQASSAKSGHAQGKSGKPGFARLPLVLAAVVTLVPLAGCTSADPQNQRVSSLCERSWEVAGSNGGKADRYSAPTMVAASCAQ